MNLYVYTGSATPLAIQSQVDAALGLPKPGTQIGGGIHASGVSTVTYFAPVQNQQTATNWGYLADAVTIPIVAPNAVSLGLPAPTPVDATWPPILI
jgi:hypothetical protein